MKPADLNVLGFKPYVRQFREHLAHTQAHFSGTDDEPLAESFFPPNGHWTAAEKDLFFHGLVVHSRMRPDLIADSINSKTLLDVLVYLRRLDEATKDTGDDDTGPIDHGIAMEMSEAWLRFEESQSAALILQEVEWESQTLHLARAQESEAEATRLDAQLPGDDSSDIRQEQLVSWKQDKDLEWARFDALQSLDMVRLRKLAELCRSPSPDTIPNVEIRGSPSPDTNKEYSPTETPPPSPGPSIPSLRLSIPPTEAVLPEQLSPRSRRRLQKRLYMRRKRAEEFGETPNDAPTKLAVGRKKKSRPKPRPRPTSYNTMRKKREKRKLKKQGELIRSEEEEEDEDEDEEYVHQNQSGKNKHIRIRELFAELGIDAHSLADLDLINFSAIGRLIQSNGMAYGSDDLERTPSTISMETIRVLNAFLVDFTTQLVQQSIIFRETERDLKKRSKVWHLNNESEITSGHVERALETIGSFQRARKRLIQEVIEEDEEQDDPDVESDGEPPSPKRLRQSPQPNPFLLPLHRELNPPIVFAPDSFARGNRDGKSKLPPEAEPLMEKETDDEALMEELEEDDIVDQEDEDAQVAHEIKLWKELDAAGQIQ
ncbi:hypothetical protein C8J56DRAFT_1059473 [Mycena floridula]|nr:hypothetical protein C8J56DRAFT_1059473 [Mycena floridula]